MNKRSCHNAYSLLEKAHPQNYLVETIVKKPHSASGHGNMKSKNTDMNHIGRGYGCDACDEKRNINTDYKTCMMHSSEMHSETFNNNNIHFKMHLISGSGEKRYECTSCNKIFKHDSNLKAHLRIHTGEKKHYCRVCGKKFNGSNNFVRHMRLHTTKKNYECYICGNQFAQIYYLKSHMKMHSAGKKSRFKNGKYYSNQNCDSKKCTMNDTYEGSDCGKVCNEQTISSTKRISHNKETSHFPEEGLSSTTVAPTNNTVSAEITTDVEATASIREVTAIVETRNIVAVATTSIAASVTSEMTNSTGVNSVLAVAENTTPAIPTTIKSAAVQIKSGIHCVKNTSAIAAVTPTLVKVIPATAKTPQTTIEVSSNIFSPLTAIAANNTPETTASITTETLATNTTMTKKPIPTPWIATLPVYNQNDVHSELAEIKQNIGNLHCMVEGIMKHFNIAKTTTPCFTKTQSPALVSQLQPSLYTSYPSVHPTQQYPGKPSYQFAQSSEPLLCVSESSPLIKDPPTSSSVPSMQTSSQSYPSSLLLHAASQSYSVGPMASTAFQTYEPLHLSNRSHSPIFKSEQHSSSNSTPDVLSPPPNTSTTVTSSLQPTLHQQLANFPITSTSTTSAQHIQIHHGSPPHYYPVLPIIPSSHHQQWPSAFSPSSHCPEVPVDIPIVNHVQYQEAYQTCTSRKELAQRLLMVIFTHRELQENSFKGHTRLGKFDPLKVEFLKMVVFTKFPARTFQEMEEIWNSLLKDLGGYLRKRRFQNKEAKDIIIPNKVQQKAEAVTS